MEIYFYQQELEGKSLEIALRRRTPIEDLLWDGRKDTFRTVHGQQKIEMLSDTIVNPKTLNSIVAYVVFFLTSVCIGIVGMNLRGVLGKTFGSELLYLLTDG
jgi:hypothetical protein